MLWIVQHLIRQTGFHHVAVLHHHQPVRQQPHDSQIVGHDNCRQPHVAHQPAQQVQQTRLHADIKATRRFVHEHQSRAGHEVTGDL